MAYIYISSMSFASVIVSALLALAYVFLHRKSWRRSRSLPYPPGPKVTSMPADDAWVEYRKWGREYGELVYIEDRNILILNDSRVAIDLLEKRARIYSDRRMTPIMKLCGAEYNMGFTPYSDNWRRKRKLFQQNFRQSAVNRFHPDQYNKVNEFLRHLITTPDKFMQHTTALSQRIMFSALWGLDVKPEDPLAQNAVKGVSTMGQAFIPGAFPAIEQFPWLRFMPTWFPGCGFARVAEQCIRAVKEGNTIPFDMAMDNLKTGKGTSLIAELASKCEGDSTEIEAIKAMATTSYLGNANCLLPSDQKKINPSRYIAAADTTLSSISSFTLSMVLNPDVQAKGQEEIDRVVGTDRLPTLKTASLCHTSKQFTVKLCDCILRFLSDLSIVRLKMISILVIIFRKYVLQGCSVIPNIWVCVGRYMADNTVWLTIASVLATLNLHKLKDKQGKDISISEDYTSGFFRHPKPFQCSITPRTPYAEKLIIATAS
ncbi:cytochrome P450 [Gymnopus androsaceus JB14]|uniref:Cytochrome P450 n=1 Tax=Gymnopus androsaceus JB14 TaxID=1447944 RepID=A0A6A4HEI9_9AGAR|nr:cytochrome P450 [Gymnopus androsaceus JB14]